MHVNANMDGPELDQSVLKLADLVRIGTEADANVKKDMLELQVFADHAHLNLLPINLRLHAFVLILINISTLQLALVLLAHLSQILILMEMTGSAEKVTLSLVMLALLAVQLMVYPTTMETAHAQEAEFSMEANVSPQFHAHLDLHSMLQPKLVFVTADKKILSTDNARLVAITASGTKINAFAQQDSSKLPEHARHVILELNTMEKTASAI